MLERLKQVFMNVSAVDVIVMVLAFTLLYVTFAFLKRNHARAAVWVFALVSVAISCLLLLKGYNGHYILLVPAGFFFMVCIIFSVEIKRLLWSRKSDLKNHELKVSERVIEKSVNEIIRAVQNMSKQDVGALIILASAPMPNSILESGTYINGDITSQLIESIFFPKTPLHDGAMIISGVNVLSAGCFLPLSQEINLPQELGTRHRAGIGITETIEVTAIIVSEETGIISVAQKGKLKRYLDNETLKRILTEYYKNFYSKNKEDKDAK